MALVIRLQPTGRKKIATYRVIVQEKRSKLTGKSVETLGHYNAQTHPVSIQIDREKAADWIAKGAIPSPTVSLLLEKENFLYTKDFKPATKLPIHKKKSKKQKEREKQAAEAAATPDAEQKDEDATTTPDDKKASDDQQKPDDKQESPQQEDNVETQDTPAEDKKPENEDPKPEQPAEEVKDVPAEKESPEKK